MLASHLLSIARGAPRGPQEPQHGRLVARVDAALPVAPALLRAPEEGLQRLLCGQQRLQEARRVDAHGVRHEARELLVTLHAEDLQLQRFPIVPTSSSKAFKRHLKGT